MPSLDGWVSSEQAEFDPTRIIARDSESLVLARGSSDLAAQTVRIAPVSPGRRDTTTAGQNTASEMEVVVIGQSNLDIKKGDLFAYQGTTYKVTFVNKSFNGQVQARAKGTQ